MEFLDRWRIHRSISLFARKSRGRESRKLHMGPMWRTSTWSTMFAKVVCFTVDTDRLSNLRCGSVADLYLHLLDNTLVLTASPIGKSDKIFSITSLGKLLILSVLISTFERNLDGSVWFWELWPFCVWVREQTEFKYLYSHRITKHYKNNNAWTIQKATFSNFQKANEFLWSEIKTWKEGFASSF